MKTIYISIIIFICGFTQAQVAIGMDVDSPNQSVILEFNSDATNVSGLRLPQTTNATANDSGTLVFDTVSKTVRVYDANSGTWKELTPAKATDVVVEYDTDAEENGEGVVMGDTTSTATGVLVLESTDKAMVLPQIYRPHETVGEPQAGMICYDTDSDTFAVFNGDTWSYWR